MNSKYGYVEGVIVELDSHPRRSFVEDSGCIGSKGSTVKLGQQRSVSWGSSACRDAACGTNDRPGAVASASTRSVVAAIMTLLMVALSARCVADLAHLGAKGQVRH